MQKLLFVIFTLFLFEATSVAQTTVDSLSFPTTWQGEWIGKLEIFSAKGKVQTLPMELHIQPLDTSWTWTIIYGEDKEAGTRSYELIELDKEKGLYAIDEKNSIKMEGYLLGNKFYQRFEVAKNLLLTTTEKLNETTLLWEIISGSMIPVSITGNQEVEGEEIPPVQTFPISILQRAKLIRK